MRCAGCNHDIEVGDRYIAAPASDFIGGGADGRHDDLIAEILGGVGGEVAFCEDCTEAGGRYELRTSYGEVPDA